jgi:hypothetical protein
MNASRVKMALVCAMAVVTAGCPSVDSLTSTTAAKPTFPAVMVTATWAGGVTGLPTDVKTVAPTNYTGALCPATALKLQNHVHDYDLQFGSGSTALVITNNCTVGFFVAVCQASGSGGVATGLPTCATDPRQTPSNQMIVTHVGTTPNPIAQTGVNLTVVIQYCSTTTAFNFGSVSGAAQTDCVGQ